MRRPSGLLPRKNGKPKVERLYNCTTCHELFSSDRTEAEAIAECRREFGPLPFVKLRVVCDNCWKLERKRKPAG